MSKDIPIFSGPMVRALLDGRKTMTRRILTANYLRIWTGGLDHGGRYVKPQAELFSAAMNNPRDWRMIDGRLCWVTDPAPHQRGAAMAQWMGRLPWSPGDRLWVRETCLVESDYDVDIDYAPPFTDGRPVLYEECDDRGRYWRQPHYRATDPAPEMACDKHEGPCCHWKPAIDMPRWASRLTLIVTGVKVERLQDISEADARAEGMYKFHGLELWGHSNGTPGNRVGNDAREAFAHLWDDLHHPGPHCWHANPYVVALTFTVHKQNIDTLPKADAA